MIPPCIVCFGLSGAGKSTALHLLESQGFGLRVRRYTTRAPRKDDDPSLVVCVKQLDSTADMVIFDGWEGIKYAYSAADLAAIRARRKRPLIEIGEYQHAKVLAELFKPAHLLFIDRLISDESLRALLLSREMPQREIELRIDSLKEDSRDIQDCISDSAIRRLINDGDLARLSHLLKQEVQRS